MFTSTSDHPMLEYPPRALVMESKWKPNIELAPNCPRCASSNTKFCYYNNYSLSQPRYFCKACRRYWTKGGSLRNVPVGGGCRKTRRSKSSRPAEKVGPSQSSSSPAGHQPTTESETSSSSGGADIDLAAVFAKYLSNDSSSNNDQETASSGASSGSLDMVPSSWETESCQIQDLIFQSQTPADFIEGAEFQDGFLPISINDDNLQFFLDDQNNQSAFELQNSFAAELSSEELIDSEVTNLQNSVPWQSMVQLQDFGSFLPHDYHKNSMNFMAENWSSFDLSGYENLSRP